MRCGRRLDWNFGEGHQAELFDAYGIKPDHDRIRYYRELWDLRVVGTARPARHAAPCSIRKLPLKRWEADCGEEPQGGRQPDSGERNDQ